MGRNNYLLHCDGVSRQLVLAHHLHGDFIEDTQLYLQQMTNHDGVHTKIRWNKLQKDCSPVGRIVQMNHFSSMLDCCERPHR